MELIKFVIAQLKENRISKNDALAMLNRLKAGAAVLHPLLHRNTSDFSGQRFESALTGEEFFLREHVIGGHRVLPGPAYLEMARAALEASLGDEDAQGQVTLREVVWLQPFVVGDRAGRLRMALDAPEALDASFEIYSEDAGGKAIVHCRGQVARQERSTPPRIDVQARKAQCTLAEVEGARCYEAFEAAGIAYGPSFRALHRAHVGTGETLVELCLPDAAGAPDAYVLHPSLLDAALQGCACVVTGDASAEGAALRASLLFSVRQVDVFDACTARMWAWIREAQGSTERVRQFDIDVCDEHGQVRVRLSGVSTRVQDKSTAAAGASSGPAEVAIELVPVWDVVHGRTVEPRPAAGETVYVVGGTPAQHAALFPQAHIVTSGHGASVDERVAQLSQLARASHIAWIAPADRCSTIDEEKLLERQREGILSCYRLIKALLQSGYGSNELSFTAVTQQALAVSKGESIDPTHAGVHGLMGVAAKEYPKWKVKLVDLSTDDVDGWSEVATLTPDAQGNGWAHRRGEWYRQSLLPCEVQQQGAMRPYRDGGVYVVIGGAGGIGESFSEQLIRRHRAKMIWIGRQAPSEAIAAKCARLGELGPAPEYVRADASDRVALEAAYRTIQSRHGQIHGVVHSAVGIFDESLANMSAERFSEVLRAKVDVSVTMAQVFANEPLDFILFFSGLNSFSRDAGKSGYAAGCTFKDAYAHQLGQGRAYPVKIMNWGWWGDVGAAGVVPQSFKNRMALAGIAAIGPDDAMAGLDALLGGPFEQLGFMKVARAQLGNWAADSTPWLSVPVARTPSAMSALSQRSVPDFGSDARASETRAAFAQVNQRLGEILAGQLRALGLIESTSRPGMPAMYVRWLQESLRELGERGLLAAGPNEAQAWENWEREKAAWCADPNLRAQVLLVETTMRALPRILTGEVPATQVMFPNGSMELVEGIYKNNAPADYFNAILGDQLVAYIEARAAQDPAARIRILEIGAGTGGTSAGLFEKLWPHRQLVETYSYTDLSKAFLLHAQAHYAERAPYLDARLFDVERELGAQSIDVGSYDVVIAANVLHATKNIRQTLRNAKAALAPNGIVLLNEVTGKSLLVHLTFGLLEGWWRYEDEALRMPGTPCLTARGWQWALEAEGFRTVSFPAAKSEDLGQQIIVAESDGVIRQHRHAHAEPVGDAPHADACPQPAVREDGLRDKSVAYVRGLVSKVLKIGVSQIDPSEALERYGIDSILVVQLTDALRVTIPDISSTIFFEHQTIDSLVDHLLSTKRDALLRITGSTDTASTAAPAPVARESVRRRARRPSAVTPAVASGAAEPAIEDRRIAIIGLTGRYPQAGDVDAYWENLKSGKDCVTEIPAERWSLEGFYSENVEEAVASGKSYCRWGGFIDGFADFDPLFFNISPLEAEGMDPQERLFMQSCWEVLEDAGYTRASLAAQYGGNVGVFVGITKGGFALHGPDLWRNGVAVFPHTQFSSVANRVSYFLNLNGPSLPIDTMCSSSLTAIHEACEHLLRDECELAIAGGVNVYLHPSSYVLLCMTRMLAPRGRCRSFGVGGDGMVPGEGVGTVLLKRLSQAEADGDSIYGVILGTSINHGGKTNGYTVPNPTAHKNLVKKAIAKAGIDARAISYIEAHGTGTELGDPIEITGLTQAFREFTPDAGFCAIASAKSNIGHAESAAGIAGLTKVLLQFKHRQIAPSLHVEELNPHISFATTPFVVQRELGEWKRPVVVAADGRTREVPRTAGISSFGAGGSNAHVIVQEYADARPNGVATGPVAVVLSAKTEAQLKARVERLLGALQRGSYGDADLRNIAYTLQIGREPMEHRLAFTVSSSSELRDKLGRFLSDGDIDGCFRGEIKKGKDGFSIFAEDEDLQKAVEAWVEKKKYARLLDLWVKGLPVDWARFYAGEQPKRVSLPTYPFTKDRIWFSPAALAKAAPAANGVSVLHPLVHRNTSDFSAQRFTTEMTGNEFFLKEHVIQGHSVLPGAAYLEMARVAFEASIGADAESSDVVLEDVVWLQPFVAGGSPTPLHVAFDAPEEDSAPFEIYSEAPNGEPIIHCRGRALSAEKGDSEESLDLGALQARCADARVEGSQCYEAFHAAGIGYGPAFQALKRAYVGSAEALVELGLPNTVQASADRYVLHPSLLDSALQGCACAMLGASAQSANGNLQAALLFSVERVEVLSACAPRMWAWIRLAPESTERVRKFDIDLCDERGTVCVRMRGASSRVHEKSARPTAPAVEGEIAISLVPVWEAVYGRTPEPRPNADEVVWVVGGEPHQHAMLHPRVRTLAGHRASVEEMIERLKSAEQLAHVVWIAPPSRYRSIDDETILEEQQPGVLGAYRLIKTLLQLGYGSQELTFTAITIKAQPVLAGESIDPTHATVHGLMGTLAKEHPKWKVRTVDLDSEGQGGWSDVLTLAPDSQGDAWAYRRGEWFRQVLLPSEIRREDGAPGYREGGVYVVIGGAGGIGEVFSEQMIRRHRAQLVWLGRQAPSDAIEAKRTRLGALGPAPVYLRADASDRAALENAYREIKSRYGHIHGVVHSAVGIFDESLANMSIERFAEVLTAKTDVSVRIAQVFANEPLDFILFFSGLNSFSKDAGKGGYSAGCTFEDAYARQLGKSRAGAVKVMNWGWWGEVGAAGVVPQTYKNRISLAGITAIGADDAMTALEALLGGPFDQIGLMKMMRAQARQWPTTSAQWLVPSEGRAPSVVANLSRRAVPTLATDVRESESRAAFAQVDLRLGEILASQLRTLGLRDTMDAKAIEAWGTSIGMPAMYVRWLQASLQDLQGRDLLAARETEDETWGRWERDKPAWLADSNLRAQVRLVETTLRALPLILTGKVPATQVMFPNSSMALVEDIYKNNGPADYFNAVLADQLVGYVEARLAQDPGARLRILEIGAGTGGTSAGVFEKLWDLRQHVEAYCYTDLSKAFLLHAQTNYAPRAPYLKCQLLDVERELAEQSIEPGSYDVVIAANVLHATQNIRRTMRHVKSALKANGVLLLNEIIGKGLLVHLTFGLLEGWWRYEDEALRLPGTPALSVSNWQRVLEEEGFRAVNFPAAKSQDLGQQIVVAEADGIIRQRRFTQEGPAPVERPVAPAPVVKRAPARRAAPAAAAPSSADGERLLREKSVDYLRTLVGKTLKIDVGLIDPAEALERYGIDSILVVQLTDALKEAIPDISSTLFFEYQSIDGLVGYLLDTRRDALRRLTGVDRAAEAPAERAVSPVATPSRVVPRVARRRVRSQSVVRTEASASPAAESAESRKVAIIGLSGRYPQARTLDGYWENLKNGKDSVTEIPAERWTLDGFYCEDMDEAATTGKSYCRWGGFLDGFDEFDPLFFNISPVEAEGMDPQERLFMQSCWEVLEDAGYTRESIARRHGGRVGVFAGITKYGFELHGPDLWRRGVAAFPHTSFSSVANRVSYFLNLNGPSMPIDTMCSASLTAIHEACEHLLRDECELAIAGGVNLYLHPSSYVLLCMGRMLSPSGRCKSFGLGGDGMVPGEGVGTVLLKRLPQAEADGDPIYGVVRGTSINHGGKTNGYTVPNPTAHKNLIRQAIVKAGVDPRAISYIEAHGTGTELGDPIEIAGLTQAFREFTQDEGFCAIASSKSNIGHSESAAGIAGLTKVLLQMKHGQLAPSLHTADLNPHIAFEKTPFVVQRQLGEWRRPVLSVDGNMVECPRMAGISSFGAGGSNAHVIVEEYIDRRDDTSPGDDSAGHAAVIVLSAKSGEQLQQQARNLLEAIRSKPVRDADLRRLAYTLQVGREPMEERLAVLAGSADELAQKLQAFLDGEKDFERIFRGQAKRDKDALSIFTRDEEFEEALDKWIQRGKWRKLAELWVRGVEMDWERLYGERKPRRISLPTYPFARERYWLPLVEEPRPEPPPEKKNPASAELLEYEECWAGIAPSPSSTEDATPLRWIHVTRDEAFGAELEGLLRARHPESDVVRVVEGPAAPRTEEDYRALFEQLRSRGSSVPFGVLYGAGEGEQRLRGLHGLLRAARDTGLALRRLVITGSLEQGDARSCYDASLIGFQRSLGLLLPDLRVSAVYGSAGDLQPAQLARALGQSGVVRCEGNELQRLAFRPVASSAVNGTSKFRSGGIYLITGGAGGLGALVAEHLAKQCQARIALMGRRAADGRIEAQLDELRALGASDPFYVRADVADRAQVRDAVAAIVSRWGALHGIVHAAGLESRQSLLDKDWTAFTEVLRPKIDGTRILDECTAHHTLDFVCYFSSTAAVLGDGGGCDYASGNRFQMAYARYREGLRARGERHGRTVALCWPLWRDGGMSAVGSEPIEMYLRSSGQRYLECEEGLRAWERALHGTEAARLILAGQPQRVQGFLSRSYAGSAAPPTGPSAVTVAQDLSALVVRDLKARVEAVLKISDARLSDDTNFADIGFDSIGLAQFSRVLTTHFGFEVLPAVFYNYSTIGKLTGYLLEQHRDALERFYRTAIPHEATEPAPHVEPAPSLPIPSVSAPPSTDESIAIIGMSVRTAGARDPEELWTILRDGRKQIEEIPAERWDWRTYYAAGSSDNRIATNKGGFLGDLEQFDPRFFEISPREAQWMEPRQRLILQEAWRAFEDAGYAGERLRGTECGVFIGVEENLPAGDDASGATSHQHNGILAARVSYVLDLRGPNMAINTACSSGLVAVHNACQSILRGECTMALAGGVNVLTSPLTYIALSQSGMLSADGECYAFDERANGMVAGEAVAAVVLKSLSRAVADGDVIHGVIRASGINYDGKTNGITAPSGLSQQRLIERVLQRSGIGAERIQYVLGHSVGSSLGDPIEVQALSDAFGARGLPRQSCFLGSIKPLIGHTFAASGVVSLIAMCLAMRHRMIPGTGNYRQANRYIHLPNSPFRVSDAARPWDAPAQRRCGLVGATGMSGTNAFALVEEYPRPAVRTTPGASKPSLIVLSAKNEAALRQVAQKLRAHLAASPELDPADVAFTLQVGREAMPSRLAISASSIQAILDGLDAYVRDPSVRNLVPPDGPWAATAASWLLGAKVDWSAHPGGRRVPLPAYPFEVAGASTQEKRDPILEIIAGYSKRDAASIDRTATLDELGIDSLLRMKMTSSLEEAYSIVLSLEDVTDCQSVGELRDLVRERANGPVKTNGRRYEELEVLQSRGSLEPVFWFHGSMGTVQAYIGLSRALGKSLPFFGIQSRGIKSDHEPIRDLGQMASSYADILLATRREPGRAFRLGGYSEGGLIAYEVARVLQRRGQPVESLVMLDTPYPYGGSSVAKDADTRKLRYAMVYVNLLLMNGLGDFSELEHLGLDTLTAETVLPALVRAGIAKGLKYTPDELRATLERCTRVAEANEVAAESYVIGELEQPSAVECHYFQRSNPEVYFHPRHFKGAMVERTNQYFHGKECATGWRRYLPRFHHHVTEAADHFELLYHASSFDLIRDVCRIIYGASPDGEKLATESLCATHAQPT